MHNRRRIRIRVDETGQGVLHRLTHTVDALGGNILVVDLQDAGDDGVIEAIVALPVESLGREAIVAALEKHQAGSLISNAAMPRVVDPIVAAIRWSSSIISAGEYANDELRRVIAEICTTSDVWLLPFEKAMAYEVACEVRRTCLPSFMELPNLFWEFEASFCGPTWLLAVPNARLDPSGVALVARPLAQPFTVSEIERVEAVLALGRRANVVQLSPTEAVDAAVYDFDFSS